jgi:hypothetical protein
MRYVGYPKDSGGQKLFGVYDLANEAVSTKEIRDKKGSVTYARVSSACKGLTDARLADSSPAV